MVTPEIYVSTFANKKDVNPNQPPSPLSWDAIVQKFSTHIETDNKDSVLLWSPTKYPAGMTRANRNVELISCVVLDYDGTETWETVEHKLKEYDLIYLAHSTFSNAPDDPCFRVIIPLDKPLGQSEWATAWRRVYGVFGGDKQTSDIARIYYLPSCPPDADRWVRHS